MQHSQAAATKLNTAKAAPHAQELLRLAPPYLNNIFMGGLPQPS